MNNPDDIADPIDGDDLVMILPADRHGPRPLSGPAALHRNDLKRFLATARFLAATISDMDSANAASSDRAAEKRMTS